VSQWEAFETVWVFRDHMLMLSTADVINCRGLNCCLRLVISKHAVPVGPGRVNGAVTLPLPVSQQLASGLQSGPLSSLLGAAGIRSVVHSATMAPGNNDFSET